MRFAAQIGRDAPPGDHRVTLHDTFERCLASLYEAALDGARWPAATAVVEEAVGTSGNALQVAEGFDDDIRMHFARFLRRGEHREDLARTWENYRACDERPPRVRQLPHGRLVHVRALYTEEELKTSRAYNEGMCLLGSQYGLNVRFDGPDGLRIVWSLGDPLGGDGWQSERLRLLERLLPHVHRSVLIRQALAAADALAAGRAGLLESDRIGAVHLDRGGRVLAANGPALEILRRGDGLLDRDGSLDAWLPADGTRLRHLVGRALPVVWDEAPAGGSMTVRRSSSRSRLGLHVIPVGDRETDFGGRRVAALVLVVDPARRPRIDAARVAATLGLTRSESRMAALLAEGLRVCEIAAATEWSEDYVRWLSKRAYRKLGLSGRVELVRQVLAVDTLPRH